MIVPTYKGEAVEFLHPAFVESENQAEYYRRSAAMDRTYEQYCEAFGFPVADVFAGKRVLDLGAGVMATFAAESDALGMKVTSVNPNWSHPCYRTDRKTDQIWQGNGQSIAAVAQELPFQDSSFDLVLSLWGVPAYLPGTKNEYRRTFSEVNRVLADDGIALMFPIAAVSAKKRTFTEALEESGASYKLLTKGIPPKLLIEKNIRRRNQHFIRTLTTLIDRQTEPFLI